MHNYHSCTRSAYYMEEKSLQRQQTFPQISSQCYEMMMVQGQKIMGAYAKNAPKNNKNKIDGQTFRLHN